RAGHGERSSSSKTGALILVDGGVNSQPVEPFRQAPFQAPPFLAFPAELAPFFPAHPGSGYSNQVGIRQARLQVEGMAFHDWDYKFQYEFVGPSNGLV